MDEKVVNVHELERLYLQADAQYFAQQRLIDNLNAENKHLRQVIEMLITSKPPTL